MLQIIAKTAIKILVPKLMNSAYSFLLTEIVERKKVKIAEEITKKQYDYIIDAYYMYMRNQSTAGLESMVKNMNEVMGTQFSKECLSKVWMGKVSRDALPDGTNLRSEE